MDSSTRRGPAETAPIDPLAFQYLGVGVAVFLVLNLSVTLRNNVVKAGIYPTWVAVLGCVLAVLATVCYLVGCARGRPSGVRTRALAPLCLAMMAAHVVALAVTGTQLGRNDFPPLLHWMGAGVTCAVAPWGVRGSLVLLAGYAPGYLYVRSRALDWPHALTEALVFTVAALTFTLIVSLMTRAVRELSGVAARVAAERARSEQAAAAAFERTRWDALVHDKVLGALRLAATATTREHRHAAAALATDALAALDGHADRLTDGPAPTLTRLARDLDLDADIDVQATGGDPLVLEAVTAAAAECVTNVARHSGQQRVRVHGFVHPHRAHVTVHDHGRGFEAAAARRRSGLRTSVTGRMRSVGGTARVDSAPGCGTTVVLEWRADADRGEPLLLWPARTFAPMVAMGAAVAALNIALGLDRPVPFAWAPTPYVVAAVIIVAGLATVVLPVRSRWWFAWLAVMVCAPAVIAAGTTVYGATDWRYWTVGAIMPALACAAFRHRGRFAAAAAVGSLALLVAVEAATGRASLAPVFGHYPVLFGTIVIGCLARKGLDRGTARINADMNVLAQIQAQQARHAAAEAEGRRPREQLDSSVAPMLVRVARQEALGPADRLRAGLLEAGARDLITAPALATPAVARAAAAARARGVFVTMNADEGPRLEVIERLLPAVLTLLPESVRVRVTVETRTDGHPRASISIVGPLAPSVATAVAQAAYDACAACTSRAAGGPRGTATVCEVTADDLTVLITLTPKAAWPAGAPRHSGSMT